MQTKQRYKIAVIILSIALAIESIALISLLARRPPKKIPEVAIPIKGKIAIVIDDWGYNLDNLYILDQIKFPITASILPRLNYSQDVAHQLHNRGFQVILHLPMEPHEKYRLENNTILTSMDEETIVNIIAQDLEGLRYAVGVSNHMGSSATEDLRTMSIILRELKKRRLFFLDSLVSTKSVCSDLAQKLRVRFIRRDIFLDNEEDSRYIKSQINKLKKKARIFGRAVGIGHDRRVTLEVLRETMPELEREGYKLVFVSELVK